MTTVMHKVLKESPLNPSVLNVLVPKELDSIVKKAMAKRPEDRFPSAGAFANALRRALEEKEIVKIGTLHIVSEPEGASIGWMKRNPE